MKRMRAVRDVGLVGLAAAALWLTVAMLGPPNVMAACSLPAVTDGNEPPCNPHMAASEWPGAQRANYQQASSPFFAPTNDEVDVSFTMTNSVPIFMGFTSTYAGGGQNAWMSTLTIPDESEVLKIDAGTGQVIDTYDAVADEGERPRAVASISGAYNLLDSDNHFFVGRQLNLSVYGDQVEGDRLSPIALLGRITLNENERCRESDRLVGIVMTAEGEIAFATEQGVVGVVPRQLDRFNHENLRVTSLNGDRCSDPSVPDEDLETVSNSIAADEADGIYVVTSEAQYKLRAAPDSVAVDWRAAYETGENTGGARLGAGSGSTPSLVGTEPDDDRFVVITDGQKLVNLTLLWRDDIPANWEPLEPGKDRRIACEVPIDFGNDGETESNSEQSVLVRGNASVVVNNELAADELLAALPPQVSPLSVLSGQIPQNAPKGIQRVDWDPDTRTCSTRWTNSETSIPNGVPTMSSRTNLFYGIGQKSGSWGLQAVDFDTGEEEFFAPSSAEPNRNSFFAGTTIGPGGAVFTGTFGGISIFRPREGEQRRTCKGQTATLVGTPKGDVIRGTPDVDVVNAGRGPDTVLGFGGDDVICARGGDDRIRGGAGDDLLRGGTGIDRISGGGGDDLLKGGFGDDRLSGSAGDDEIHGSPGDDVLRGGRGTDRAVGGEGADQRKLGPQG